MVPMQQKAKSYYVSQREYVKETMLLPVFIITGQELDKHLENISQHGDF